MRWLRSQEHIPFTRPNRFLALGIQGSGKSSLLEVIALRYTKIFDIYGETDSEGLCWCKKEFREFFKQLYGREPNILLVVGDEVEVASQWDDIRASTLKLSDFEQYDVITSVYALYENEEKYFEGSQKIMSTLYKQRNHWTEPWFLLVREAANLVYARLKVVKDTNVAKKDLIKSYRGARHHGLAMGLDTLRWTNIDKEIRDLAQFTFIKSLGDAGLPDDLRWMYRYFKPFSLMKVRKKAFALKTHSGAVGFGKFDYPPWHKEEKENILRTTGIEVKRAKQVLPDNMRYGITDMQHADIITRYVELQSMAKVGGDLGRSPASIKNHIDRHNMSINRFGECPKCRHAKCEFSKDHIINTRRK